MTVRVHTPTMATKKNKRTGPVSSRRQALEDSLTADHQVREELIGGGRDKVDEPQQRQVRDNSSFRSFAIHQGRRRRHPNQVLHQYFGANKDIYGTPKSIGELALYHEEEKMTMKDLYTPGPETTMMAAQYGILDVANHNKGVIKNKLEQQSMIVGI